MNSIINTTHPKEVLLAKTRVLNAQSGFQQYVTDKSLSYWHHQKHLGAILLGRASKSFQHA